MMSQARILVVDDEPDTLGLIELTLQTAGFSVRTAANGDQALKLLLDDTFDLLLLDIMMPGMTGFDLLEILKNRKVDIPPVVFLTAKSRQEDREKGDSLGAAAFLTKPTTRGDLLDTIRSIVGE
jgi:DNA-binding response OmpR family regulator